MCGYWPHRCWLPRQGGLNAFEFCFSIQAQVLIKNHHRWVCSKLGQRDQIMHAPDDGVFFFNAFGCLDQIQVFIQVVCQ